VITRLTVIALASLASTPIMGSMLPERLGEFTRGQLSALKIAIPELQVLEEYGLRTAEHATRKVDTLPISG
jgi:hypothetical protein